MYFGESTYRVGDKVMQIVNNYQQQWTQHLNDRMEKGTGVYNGELGYIVEINPQAQRFTIRFTDDKLAVYPYSDLDQIVLAYAVSIHKSQGSEFDAVIVAVTAGNYMIMTRNLLYTAVTRAKKLCIIVGSKDSLAKMVKNNYTAARYSLLKDFLQNEEAIQNN
jgi:exodeoxyribonuclease V alpha subunit